MQDLIEVLAAAAHAFRRGQAAGSGQPFAQLRSILAAHPTTASLPEAERFRALLLLRQVAAVGHGDDTDCEQEFLADWLAARHAARLLRRDPAAVAEAVGDVHAVAPAFERALADEFADDPELAARVQLALPSCGDGAAAGVLRRILLAVPRPAAHGGGLLHRLFRHG